MTRLFELGLVAHLSACVNIPLSPEGECEATPVPPRDIATPKPQGQRESLFVELDHKVFHDIGWDLSCVRQSRFYCSSLWIDEFCKKEKNCLCKVWFLQYTTIECHLISCFVGYIVEPWCLFSSKIQKCDFTILWRFKIIHLWYSFAVKIPKEDLCRDSKLVLWQTGEGSNRSWSTSKVGTSKFTNKRPGCQSARQKERLEACLRKEQN